MALLRAAIRTFRNERDDNCIPRRPSNWWNDSFLVCRREKKKKRKNSQPAPLHPPPSVVHVPLAPRCPSAKQVARNRTTILLWLKSRGNFRENESLPFIELTLPSLLRYGSLIPNRRKFWFNVWKIPLEWITLASRIHDFLFKLGRIEPFFPNENRQKLKEILNGCTFNNGEKILIFRRRKFSSSSINFWKNLPLIMRLATTLGPPWF